MVSCELKRKNVPFVALLEATVLLKSTGAEFCLMLNAPAFAEVLLTRILLLISGKEFVMQIPAVIPILVLLAIRLPANQKYQQHQEALCLPLRHCWNYGG